MPIDPGLVLAQWFSPGYPVGAFAYSHGLETAIVEGVVADAAGLEGWVAGVMRHGSARNDAILLAASYHAPEVAEELDALAGALAVSAERLTETRAQGAAFARTTAAVWGIEVPDFAYPVACGVAARALDLPLERVLRHYLLGFAGNLVSAAVRRVPLGQTEGQRVLAALAPLAEALAVEAAPGDTGMLGGAALAADIAAMRHETLDGRLFRT